MAVIFYPLGTELYKRTTSTGSLVELVLNAPPNAVFVFTGSSEYSSSFQFDSASYAKTASVALNATPSVSASWASASISSSHAITASYALNGGSEGSSTSASWASSSLTASAMTPTMPYTTIVTSSTNWITASFLIPEQYINITNGYLYNFTCSDAPSMGQISSVTLLINNTATTTSSLSFPSNWMFIGSTPTSLSSSRGAVLSLRSYGGTKNVAAWGVQY